MTERTLTTVRTVDHIMPIDGADAIEAVVLDGWTVVTKKGEFQPGQPAVYFEVDAALPVADPRFAFLADRSVHTRPDGTVIHRLKTVKLRGVYSQGLALPLADFPEVDHPATVDLDALLGVTKYVPAGWGFTSGDAAGPFPTHVAEKTDSERVQNLVQAWPVIRQFNWFATEKIDGTSLTVARDGHGELIVASRNMARKEGDNVYWNAVRQFDLDRIGPNEAVQAEVYGPGIQKNPLGINNLNVAVFHYVSMHAPLPRVLWPEWATDLAAPIYPLELPEDVPASIEQVDGIKSLISPQRLAEGVVWHEANAQRLAELEYRSTFKAISNKFLVKSDS